MLDFFKIGNIESKTKSTGVTVILAEDGAIGGVSVRGSAPATRETDLLKSENSVDKVNAVFLSGGSAFGLDSASGIVQYLAEKGIGYTTTAMPVPIVCGACLYDLEYKNAGFPDKELGYKACLNAKENNFESGNVGAGCGATVGKVLGAMSASKGGLGVATFKFDDGVEMCAIVAVNAFGDIYDFRSGQKVSGAVVNGQSIDIIDLLNYDRKMLQSLGQNTTIGCILTNAKLNKSEANKLADIAHDGYAMTIKPSHTMVDGDAIFALASGEVEGDFMKISCYAPTLMAKAVLNAFGK
ncbi:MAG: P1 family peptidase [Clostridia bacterium]|nr:P1 family peptidase [Clostridia bacterium]